MSKLKRAYSDEEKQQREQRILDAAQLLLMQKSFHTINMSEIAQMAELAKGTVYLYFQTKEELFLTLYQRKFGIFLEDLKHAIIALEKPVKKSDMVDLLVTSVAQDPQLIRLSALSNLIFEHNISYDKARDYKYWLFDRVGEVGSVLEERLNLQAGQGLQTMCRLYVFVIGLENIANPAPITQALYKNEPSLIHLAFEDELRALTTMLLEAL